MKLEKLDHKHALTSWLKVILFACLMLAPIISVVVRSLYVVCNKNAKDSYSNYVDTITTNVSLTSNLVNGQTYTINPLTYSATTNTTYYEVLNNQTNIKQLYFADDTNFNTITKFAMATSGTRTRLIVYNDQNYNASVFDITNPFYFVSNGTNETNSQSSAWWTITTLSYTTGKLDNVFDYSISQIEQSQFYNWTQNTAIYNGVEAMTTGLGITGATVPILITYWFLLTVIYVVIDIVINLFTYLTHFLNKKTN